jgi:hypothetical protein
MTLGLTQPLTKMRPRNISGRGGGEARPVFKPDNLTASLSLLSRKGGILDVSQPYRRPRPVTGIALIFTYQLCLAT